MSSHYLYLTKQAEGAMRQAGFGIAGDQSGSRYCEAIDNDWSNRMPSDGFEIYPNEEDRTFAVSFISHFACYDGWDSCDAVVGTFSTIPAMLEAVRIWAKNCL